MKTFVNLGLNEAYKRVERLGDRLAEIESMIDWEAFRPIVGGMYDNQVDLSKKGEVVYRDRGFHGAKAKGYSATMRRGARDHPIGIMDKLRNLRLSKKRADCFN